MSLWSVHRQAVVVWSVLALVAAACSSDRNDAPGTVPALAPAVRQGELDVDGVKRSYRLFVPTTLDRRQAVPLVVALHGGGNSVDSFVETTRLDQAAAVGNFVVAYPEATGLAWNAGRCCGSAPTRGVDDMSFLSQLVDELVAGQSLDPARVFMTGISNGAMMAYRFACERAEQVRAIASVAGSIMVEECAPERPVAVLELRGSDDPLVPFDGGLPDLPELDGIVPYRSAPAVAEQWATLDGCTSPPTVSARGAVTTTAWEGCEDATAVRLVRVEGGGHVWFAPGLGGGNSAVQATQVVTDFFAGVGSP